MEQSRVRRRRSRLRKKDITGIRPVISEGNGGIMGIFGKGKAEAENEVENEQQNMGQQGGMQAARDTIGRQGGGPDQGQGMSQGQSGQGMGQGQGQSGQGMGQGQGQ